MFDFKEFRSLNKLKQSDVAAYFGCAQAFISQIERGISKIPEDFISKIKSDGIYSIPKQRNEVIDDVKMPREVFDKISMLIDTVCSQQNTIASQQRTIDSHNLSDRRENVQADDGAECADVK